MRIRLIFSFFLFTIFSLLNAQTFTAGNLVVLRVGDGSTTLSNNAAQVSLVEMTTGGSVAGLMTVNLPTSVSGGNRILTQSGTATSEGEVSLSTDCRYLVCCGYDAAVGTSNVKATTNNGVIGRVDASGTVNTATYFDRSNAFNSDNFRSVCTVDGTSYWGCGNASTNSKGGVRYILQGATATAGTRVNTNLDNSRVVKIFNNQLYIGAASSSINVGTVGTGLPTSTGNTVTNMSGIPAGSDDTYSYVFFDVDGNGSPDLLYYAVADGNGTSSSGVYKYSSANGGASWTARGKIVGTSGNLPRGITGRKNCSGNFDLYFTTMSSGVRPNKVWSFTDNANFNANMTSNGSNIIAVAATIFTAAANYALGGICFTPTQGDLVVNSAVNISGNYRSLTINSGTATLTANVTVQDTVYVANGATLDCGNFNLFGKRFVLASGGTLKIGSANGITAVTMSGNIQTSCRSYSTGANYVYEGTVGQVTGDGLPSTVNTLLLTNSSAGTVALTNGVSVTSVFTLTQGILDLNAKTLTILNSLPTSIVRTAGYVLSENTSNTSQIKWQTGATVGTYVFPFGVAGTYIPFTFDVTSAPANDVTLSTYGTPPTNLPWPTTPTNVTNLWSSIGLTPDNEDATVDRFWQITVSGAPTATLTFNYTASELPISPYNTPNSMEAQRYDGATNIWQLGLPGQSSGSYFVTVPGVTTFSPWTLASTLSPLPVELLHFDATLQDNSESFLTWATATETNNHFFDIEKTTDGMNWGKIGQVSGNGTCSQQHNYSFVDPSVSALTYYRLKQVDFNGQFEYSPVRVVAPKVFSPISLFPNPAENHFTVSGLTADEPTSIFIYDCAGKLLQVTEDNQSEEIISIADFPTGFYLVRVVSGDRSTNFKLIKSTR